VLLVKEILITVPNVLKTEPSYHTVMNVHMDYMTMVLPPNVKTVDLDSHSVTDVTETPVGNVMLIEVPQIVDVSLDMSNQPEVNIILQTLLSAFIVNIPVLNVLELGIIVPHLVPTKPEDLYHTVHVMMDYMMMVLKTQNVTSVLIDV
jgi:hypothetical protein